MNRSRISLLSAWVSGMMLMTASAAADNPPVPAGHPRVYVTADEIPSIQAKLDQPGFDDLWSDIQASDHPVCLAFVYLVTDDAAAGRAAVDAALPELQACDDARVFENPMHNAAIVYDWCYDLLTEGEKSSFVAEFERIAASHGPGYPAEAGQGAVVGHTTEGWLLTDQIPAGLAIYDEQPLMYDAGATVFFDEFVPVRNYLYPAHMHHQGDSYTGTRFQHDIGASWLFRKIGGGDVFTREQQYVPYQLVYNLRPDGQQMRSGDTYDDRGMSNGKRRLMMLTGSYYEDPTLLWMADSDFYWSPSDLDRVLAVVLRPAGVSAQPVSGLPLTKFFPEPMGEMTARTGWTMGVDSRDAVIHMRIGKTFFGNHQRKDFGVFQIYYRGALAISSGVYEGTDSEYGSSHWINYYHQTVAHNGLLIFDPGEEMILHGDPQANDGGQQWPNNGADHPRDLPTILDSGYEVGAVTARAFGPDAAAPEYSYLAGDITAAYSASKASLVTRSMAALNLLDALFPAALVVFDRVVSTDPDFKKTWLLHSMEEPAVIDREITITRTGPTYDDSGEYGGRLVAVGLLPEDAEVVTVGGPGREFWIESTSTNYWTEKSGAAEAGAWRVEVSPASPAASDRFLHVLTVMDASTGSGPEVALVRSGGHVGAAFLDRMVLFNEESGLLTAASFEVTGDGNRKVLVCDLAEGWWNVLSGGETVATLYVAAEETCLYYEAAPGSYTLEPGEPPEGWEPPEDPATDPFPEGPSDVGPDSAADAAVDADGDGGEDGDGGGGRDGCGCALVR